MRISRKVGSAAICCGFLVLMVLVFGFYGEATAKPAGNLTVLMTTLGNESFDPIRRHAHEEDTILTSLGDGLGIFPRRVGMGYLPGIASSWKMAEDARTWEFTLRKDVLFHDGTPCEPADVVASFKRLIGEGSKLTSLKSQLKDVEADGDRITFHLKKPWPFFIYNCSICMPIPKEMAEKVGSKKYIKKPVMTGPFKLKKQEKGSYIEMEAFEKHYRKVPYIKNLKIRIVPERATQMAMMKAGEADIAAELEGPVIKQVQEDPNLLLVRQQMASNVYVAFTNLAKMDRPPTIFDDKRVRQALSYAIDRKLLSDKLYYGTATPAAVDMISVGALDWDPSCKPYPHDIEKGKKLLAEAGFPNGFKTKFIFTAVYKDVAEAVQGMWADIGVEAKLEMMETGVLMTKIRQRKLEDAARISRCGTFHVSQAYYLQNDQTYTHMVDEQLDKFGRTMTKLPEGPVMDEYIKNTVCKYMYDLVPSIPVVSPSTLHGVRKGLGIDEWTKISTIRQTHVSGFEWIKPIIR